MTLARHPQDHSLPQVGLDSSEDWRALGNCLDSDPEAWYPGNIYDAQEVIMICNLCPVQAQCLTWALTNDEHFGVWGGVFMEDRIQRRRLRGGR